jgi:hypothetical protein
VALVKKAAFESPDKSVTSPVRKYASEITAARAHTEIYGPRPEFRNYWLGLTEGSRFRTLARSEFSELMWTGSVFCGSITSTQTPVFKFNSCSQSLRLLYGLAFKPNENDVRFAPSLENPAVLDPRGCGGERLRSTGCREGKVDAAGCPLLCSPYEAAQGAEAVLVVTEWEEFRQIDNMVSEA